MYQAVLDVLVSSHVMNLLIYNTFVKHTQVWNFLLRIKAGGHGYLLEAPSQETLQCEPRTKSSRRRLWDRGECHVPPSHAPALIHTS